MSKLVRFLGTCLFGDALTGFYVTFSSLKQDQIPLWVTPIFVGIFTILETIGIVWIIKGK